MRSIRSRALIGGAITAFISVLIVSVVLFAYIDRVTLARFDRALYDRHIQLSVALSSNQKNPGRLDDFLTDPAYQRTYSGRYWQVTGPDGTQYTSRSLFGDTLAAPFAASSALSTWTAPAFGGGEMRGMQQLITFDDGSKWVVALAENMDELRGERSQTRRSLLLAFGFIAVFGLASALGQTAAVLRPLRRLREDVAKRWDSDEGPEPGRYPAEVAPLVADINTLIARNRNIVATARRQSADLAHALKTPTAILRNELSDLAGKGHDTRRAIEALARVDAQLGRSLARMRASNSAYGVNGLADISASVDRFRRLFGAMAERQGKLLAIDAEPGLKSRIDSQDFEEVLGNLLDNALKWSRSVIRLAVKATDGGILILVEDDGPGIPEATRGAVLDSGRRLDVSMPGTGLGLAIVNDLATAYGATLKLGRSETLDGLSVAIMIPKRLGLATPEGNGTESADR